MVTPPVAILSGGLGDIGRAVASALAARGAAIALADLRPQEDAAPFLATLPTPARYDRVEIADPAAVEHWIDQVTAALGTPTWIVPNAAQVTRKAILEIAPEDWNRELAVNLTGAFAMAQSAARRLVVAKRPGRIVFLGSWAAHAPHPTLPAYCVTKAGLRMLMQCLALELAPHDILVNEVAPGYVDAGLSGKIFAQDPEIRKQAERSVPVRRLILPEDVAAQVAWLCDPANRHQTGSVTLIDGGLSLRSPAAGGSDA